MFGLLMNDNDHDIALQALKELCVLFIYGGLPGTGPEMVGPTNWPTSKLVPLKVVIHIQSLLESQPLLRRHSFKEECLGVSNVQPSAALVKLQLLSIMRLQAYHLTRFVGKVVRLQPRGPTEQLCPFTESSETDPGLSTDLLSGCIRTVSMQLSLSVVRN